MCPETIITCPISGEQEGTRMNQVTLEKAIEGYMLYAHSRRLSEHTVRDYAHTFRKLGEFLTFERPLDRITVEQVERFLSSLAHLKKKTVLNYYVGLSALWTWALKRGIVDAHVMREIDAPKPEKPTLSIFSEDEVQRLLSACGRTKVYQRPQKRKCSNRRPTALRDKAIILTLLDSMARVTEMCKMLRSNTYLKAGKIRVKGKGDRWRIVPISSETADAIWHYLAVRPDTKPRFVDRVFLTTAGRPLDRNAAGKIIRRLGKKVGVQANPHKFRHTGATQFLRNGGNAFTLKEILGHSTMVMVERYVHLAEVDIEEAHRRASPVYNWDLKV
jgi:site-specific recombinase XerD